MTSTASHLHLDTDADLAARTAAIVTDIKATGGRPLTAALMSQSLIECPHCHEWAGWPCKTSGGWVLAEGVHAGRRNAIARMSDDEKLTAYAQRKAEQERSRAETREYFSKPLPPHVLAAREEISKAWADAQMRRHARELEIRARCYAPYVHRTDCTCRTDEEGR